MMIVFEGVMEFVCRLALWCVELVESFICCKEGMTHVNKWEEGGAPIK